MIMRVSWAVNFGEGRIVSEGRCERGAERSLWIYKFDTIKGCSAFTFDFVFSYFQLAE